MKSSEVIREAKHALFERGWTQRRYIGTDGALCLRGALYEAEKADGQTIIRSDVEKALTGALSLRGHGGIGLGFNDTEGRTFGEVIDLLDTAEKLAEEEESAE